MSGPEQKHPFVILFFLPQRNTKVFTKNTKELLREPHPAVLGEEIEPV
jgi:hypothetical protein